MRGGGWWVGGRGGGGRAARPGAAVAAAGAARGGAWAPLASLIGFSQALVDGSLEKPAERARAAEIIHEEAERVLRMSRELLDLARVESGQIPIHLMDVDLRALLEQEVEIIRPRAAGRQLEVVLQTPAELRPVRADVERLHEIVANLLDNAVKYAAEGQPIAVAVENGIQGVEVSVANGVGANPPDPDRMFDRFYRADPSRSSTAGGVGLGLSISRELAAALGGRLWAELAGSQLRLRLTLPASQLGLDAHSENAWAPPISGQT